MGDSSITKVESRHSPHGEMGQRYLASGKTVSMRLWQESAGQTTDLTRREYETVGYVIAGTAELESEGQIVTLAEGDSWVVPRGANHRYRIVDRFVAVEATSPPSHVHGRDHPPAGS
ncbi:MAG TPA: cupin domain-containing protein [Methylomirabilota bacterium]